MTVKKKAPVKNKTIVIVDAGKDEAVAKKLTRLEVTDCTDRMMGSRPILTHNNLQGKSEFKLQCNLHCKYNVE